MYRIFPADKLKKNNSPFTNTSFLITVFFFIFILFIVDDDEGVSEKKSNRSKKSTTQQQSIDRADSTIDDLLTLPSTTSTNVDIQELPTPNNPEQFAPCIPV
jgi:hypothetical protein